MFVVNQFMLLKFIIYYTVIALLQLCIFAVRIACVHVFNCVVTENDENYVKDHMIYMSLNYIHRVTCLRFIANYQSGSTFKIFTNRVKQL